MTNVSYVLLTDISYGRGAARTVEGRHPVGGSFPVHLWLICLVCCVVGVPAGYAQTSATCTTDTTTVPDTNQMACTGDDDDGDGIDNRDDNEDSTDDSKVLTYGSGKITTTGTGEESRGIDARARGFLGRGDGDVTVTNEATGEIEVSGDGVSGIYTFTQNGVARVTNAGSVTSKGNGNAIAVYLINQGNGALFAENTGTILAEGEQPVRTSDPNVITSAPSGMVAISSVPREGTATAQDRIFDIGGGEMITARVLVVNRGSITTNGESFLTETMGARISGAGGGTAYAINYGTLTANGKGARILGAGSVNNGDATAENRGQIVGTKISRGMYVSAENGDAEATNEVGGTINIAGTFTSDDVNAEGRATAVRARGIRTLATGSGKATSNNKGQLTVEVDGVTARNGVAGLLAEASSGNAEAMNSGTTTVTGGRARGLFADSDSGNAEAINSGTATVMGERAVGLVAASDSGNAEAMNSGSGTATVTGERAVGLAASSSGGIAEVINSGTATVMGERAIGLQATSSGGNAEVTNSGTLVFGGTTSRGAIALLSSDRPQAEATITNSGMVTGDGVNTIGLQVVLLTDTGGANIDNQGVVSVRGENSLALLAAEQGTMSAGKFTVTNAVGAELSATGPRAMAVVFSGGSRSAADPNEFTNLGTITGDVGFLSTSSGTAHNMFLNSGEVRGSLVFSNGGDDIVENSGMIGGMLDLGDGDDTLALMPGSMISGTVNPGEGMDTLRVMGGATIRASTIIGEFEQMDIMGLQGGTGDAPVVVMGVGSREAAASLSTLGIEPIPAPGGVARSTYLAQRQLLNTTIRARNGLNWDRAVGNLNTWGEIVFRTNGAGSGGSRYDVDSIAYLVGLDYKFRRNWDGGFAVGFSSAEADGQIYREHTHLGSGISALASAAYDNSFWRMELSGGLTHYPDADTTRPILDPALAGRSAYGEFDVTQAVVQADVSWQGHKAKHEGWGVVPRVFFAYGGVHEGSYAENGEATIQNNLARIGERQANFADAGIDVGLHWDGKRSGSSTYRFPVTAHIGVVHLLNATVDSVSYQTARGEFTRVTEGLGIGANRLEMGINIGIAGQGRTWSFSIGYEGEFTSGYEAHSGIAIFRAQLW